MTPNGPLAGAGRDTRFAFPGRQDHFVKYGGHRTEGAFELDADFVVVDVETSGLEPRRGARIIEFAAVRVSNSGQVLDSFHTLINPTDGNVGLTAIHGITAEMVRDAPTFAQVIDQVKAKFNRAIFVAHHALFDERFVANEFEIAGQSLKTMPGICTYWLSREINHKTDEFPNHKLETLTRHYKLNPGVAHSAYSDALVVAQMLPIMLKASGPHRHYVDVVDQDFCDYDNAVLRPRALSLFD